MKMTVEKGRAGGTFEDFLKEQGTLEETNAAAIKRVAAWQAADGGLENFKVSAAL
jgi:hypothetical protein